MVGWKRDRVGEENERKRGRKDRGLSGRKVRLSAVTVREGFEAEAGFF